MVFWTGQDVTASSLCSSIRTHSELILYEEGDDGLVEGTFSAFIYTWWFSTWLT